MLTTMTSQGQASQAGCKTPYGSSPQRSARTSITVHASLVQAALFFVCPCCLVPSHRHDSAHIDESRPTYMYGLKYCSKKLPAKAGQGGQGQEQSGSRSTPEKAKGAPTMTAPTMAAPTANMANISEAGDTAVHHGESSPAAGRGARTVVHVALQATPPLEEGQTTKEQRSNGVLIPFRKTYQVSLLRAVEGPSPRRGEGPSSPEQGLLAPLQYFR